ncbi:hypothetical protein PIROE2DRAFT_1407 [Piromyces sp. E2]|nr:hypothetical protein PIROE2DRAFT_1407 [Piromyces sp. E2]|eukprot:OUM70528.1 hypothetical protein PIROE2DRAFT_1407 [Piromyces sp. E2]
MKEESELSTKIFNFTSITTANNTTPATNSTAANNNKVEFSVGSKLTYSLFTGFVLVIFRLLL